MIKDKMLRCQWLKFKEPSAIQATQTLVASTTAPFLTRYCAASTSLTASIRDRTARPEAVETVVGYTVVAALILLGFNLPLFR